MNQQPLVYRFLLTPQFRIWRYLALVVFFTIVSLNQALAGYKDIIPLMGNNIYWIVTGTIFFYLVTVFVIKKIVLKHLLSGKYLLFVFYIILCASLFTAIANITFDSYVENYDFFSEITIIDNLSAFVIYVLAILGVVIPVFLRNWIVSNQHLNQLKIKQASSQIEQFKEQINPPSFFKILSRSKDFVKTEPDKASAMLMKLGQLLRYQLYDCNREQVVLTAEVSFLRNFLELEKLYSPKFDYSISIEGNITGIFIAPSILLPYVQSGINAFDNDKEFHVIDVRLSYSNEVICIIFEVSGISNNTLLQKELSKVRDRLNALYKDCYELTATENISTEKTEMVLLLDKK